MSYLRRALQNAEGHTGEMQDATVTARGLHGSLTFNLKDSLRWVGFLSWLIRDKSYPIPQSRASRQII